MKKTQPAMDWPAIKAEVHRRGMTLTALAERNGLHPTACRKVNTRTHYAAQDLIAAFIDQKPESLWPDRYPKGKPRILDTNKFPPVASAKGRSGNDKAEAA